MFTIVSITAGVSEPSTTALLGEQLSDATQAALEAAGEQVEVHQVALRQLAKPLFDFYSLGFASGELARVLDLVREADAVLAVSPTFKASYTGLFKMFWDIVEDDDLRGKPLLLGGTGGSARHSLMIEHALRPLFAYFKAAIMPTAVFAATDDYGSDSGLQSRIQQAGRELASYLLAQRPGSLREPERVSASESETLNAGSFFGIATEETRTEQDKKGAAGLPALQVTDFAKLLAGR